MKVKYEDRQKQKVIAITTDTLVVGVDIAKNYQWARKAVQLVEAAKDSIGVDYGEEGARLKLRLMLEELELLEKQAEELERQMEDTLQQTDYADFLLSIKGIGIVTLAACLGELGGPARFENPRQMSRMAGYNLVEDSSGKNKSGTKISKRGRKNLRSVLYQMARGQGGNLHQPNEAAIKHKSAPCLYP